MEPQQQSDKLWLTRQIPEVNNYSDFDPELSIDSTALIKKQNKTKKTERKKKTPPPRIWSHKTSSMCQYRCVNLT